MIGGERLRDVYNHVVTLLGGEGIHGKVGGASWVGQVIFRVAMITSVMLYSVCWVHDCRMMPRFWTFLDT